MTMLRRLACMTTVLAMAACSGNTPTATKKPTASKAPTTVTATGTPAPDPATPTPTAKAATPTPTPKAATPTPSVKPTASADTTATNSASPSPSASAAASPSPTPSPTASTGDAGQTLGTITALNRASDGTVYVGTRGGRLWRVSGTGVVSDAIASGAATIGPVDSLAIDAQNHPLVLESSRVSRLETNGTLTQLYKPSVHVAALDATLPSSGFDVLQDDQANSPAAYQLVHVDASGTPGTPVPLDLDNRSSVRLFGRDPRGNLFARFLRYHPENEADELQVDELDTINGTTGATTLVLASAFLIFGIDATQFESSHNQVVTLIRSDGTRLELGPSPTNPVNLAVLQPDDTAIITTDTQIFEVGNHQLLLMAGPTDTQATGTVH